MALILLNPSAGARALPSVDGDLAKGAAPIAAAFTRPFDQTQVGALTAPFCLGPGESRSFTFAIAWHFPNFELSDWGLLQGKGRWYATQYDSASAVVDKLAADGPDIVATIDLWRKTYYDSTLPRWLLDRSIANVSALATATCFRFADGRFYGFEGVYSFPAPAITSGTTKREQAGFFPIWKNPCAPWPISCRLWASSPMAASPCASTAALVRQIHCPSNPPFSAGGISIGPPSTAKAACSCAPTATHLLGTDDSFVKKYWPQIRLATRWLLAQDSDSDGLPDRVTTIRSTRTSPDPAHGSPA